MGCDIHVYPEYHLDDDKELETHVCSMGEYNLGRDYTLFGVLAGVRSSSYPVVPPKGLPDRLGWDAEYAYTLVAVPDDHNHNDGDFFNKTITHSKANNYLQSGSILKDKFGDNDEYWRITNPDYHTPSWLTLSELFLARRLYIQEQLCELPKRKQQKYNKILKECKDSVSLFNHNFGELESLYLNGLIGMLYSMERTNPNVKTRIVFWFDS